MIAFSCLATFGCETVLFNPYPNATNHTFLDYLHDTETDTYFLFVLPSPPILAYGFFRQRTFQFTVEGLNISDIDSTQIPPDIVGSSSSNVTQLYFNAYDVCSPVPVSLTYLDGAWKYAKTIGAFVITIGTGCVLVFIFIQSVYPYLETREYNWIALVMIILGSFQVSTIVFYTRSTACNDYPSLQEQLVNYFRSMLQTRGYNITNLDPSNITNLWDEWIMASYPPQCEWAVGSTYIIIASVFWVLTAILMLLSGPTSIVEYPQSDDSFQVAPVSTSGKFDPVIATDKFEHVIAEQVKDTNVISSSRDTIPNNDSDK